MHCIGKGKTLTAASWAQPGGAERLVGWWGLKSDILG